MPYSYHQRYRPPLLLRNGHFNTIHANLFRNFPSPPYRRTRFHLEDGDFLDLDAWYHNKSARGLAVLLHGFEGDSRTEYMKGMADLLFRSGFDIIAINMRGCSGEPNRLNRYYSGADTEDLKAVIDSVARDYPWVIPVGFSLGGNLVLKYMAEQKAPPSVRFSISISAPLHIPSSVEKIHKKSSFVYHRRFRSMLKQKMLKKIKNNPVAFPGVELRHIKSIRDFDRLVTVPAFGYGGVEEYYHDADVLQVLSQLTKPAYVINASDDPILTEQCFPVQSALDLENFHLIETKYGGHCGFFRPGYRYSYSEILAHRIIQNHSALDGSESIYHSGSKQ